MSKKQAKQTTERVPHIDIRQLSKQGYLKPDTDGNFKWSIGDELICSILYRIYKDRITLDYKHRPTGNEWAHVEQNINFDRSSCNYGGTRPWFLCPDCGKRIAIVYYYKGRFSCRHCHQLTYGSQQETLQYRMQRKARKIRERLGASDNLFEPIWYKPKNMHQATFETLCKKSRLQFHAVYHSK